jgi:hypothetical protein
MGWSTAQIGHRPARLDHSLPLNFCVLGWETPGGAEKPRPRPTYRDNLNRLPRRKNCGVLALGQVLLAFLELRTEFPTELEAWGGHRVYRFRRRAVSSRRAKTELKMFTKVVGQDSESMNWAAVERASKRADLRFDKPSVAGLATSRIAEMSREDLICVIDGSDLPLINSSNRQRLRYLDRDSLQKLAQLARRCCRNQGY